MGTLIGSHPDYHPIVTEARFHTARGGLPDLLAGRTTVDEFTARCLGQWWARGYRGNRGLQLLLERAQLAQALERFAARFGEDPVGAARELVEAIFAPARERAGKKGWVEVSGTNIINAPTLIEIFPEAKFIVMMRDGRAVTAAILRKVDMPDGPAEALGHWAGRVRKSWEAAQAIPESSLHIVHLEDLVERRRDQTLRSLGDFLGLADLAPVQAWFDQNISAERAHMGGWRDRVAPADARWIERHHRRAVRELEKAGVTWLD